MTRYDVYETAGPRIRQNRSVDEIRDDLGAGRLTAKDRVRDHGEQEWRTIGDVADLAVGLTRERFRLRRVAVHGDAMDLTPLVDVSFLLLLFFMLTATYDLQKSLEVPRPETEEQSTNIALPTLEDLREDNVIVTIEADNTIWVEEGQTTPQALVGALRATMRGTGKMRLVLKAHEDAAQGTVVAVIDAANEVGVEQIQIAVEGAGADGS